MDKRTLRQLPPIRFFMSLKLTVVCLCLLFVLTAWGTVFQVEEGLYAAQVRFFYSWLVLGAGWIPFPGGQLVLWVLFLNLTVTAIVRFAWRWARLGILLIHMGLILLLCGSFVTYRFAIESELRLEEGMASNMSTDRRLWELSVWQEDDAGRDVVAFDFEPLHEGQRLAVEEFGFELDIVARYTHSTAQIDTASMGKRVVVNLMPEPTLPDPIMHAPGLKLKVAKTGSEQPILLYGAPNEPRRPARAQLPATEIDIDGKPYFLALRHRRYPLPFVVRLQDFRQEEHPGTEIAKSFESTVSLAYEKINRDVRIFMNNPLRYGNHTLYQASYAIDPETRTETSVFAVVQNTGRLLPYISSGIVFAGLMLHFVVMMVQRMKARPTREEAA